MRRVAILALFAACVLIGCDGDPQAKSLSLPAVFSEHAVLQQGKPLYVWGWDKPCQEVTVVLAGQRRVTQAGPGGKWIVRFDPLPAGGPHELTVYGSGKITRNDILVGEVWICSGQSNMAWPVRRADNAETEIRQATWPEIRLLQVPRETAAVTQWDIESQWKRCSPDSAADFSAVGYFFGRGLHKATGVPIGLIDASWGGSRAEAWTPRRALATSEIFGPRLDALDRMIRAYRGREKQADRVHETLMARYRREMARYLLDLRERDPGFDGHWHSPDLDDNDWNTMALPTMWETSGLDGFDGSVWFRRQVDIPQGWTGLDLVLSLGPVDDADITWFNGRQVGGIGYETDEHWRKRRRYTIPGKLVKPGRNVITVRVVDLHLSGGFAGKPRAMFLTQQAAPAENPIDLSGPWKYKPGLRVDAADAPKRPEAPTDRTPGRRRGDLASMYNGMIAPLAPYPIAGVVWYQGESNAGNPEQYRHLLSLLIRGWRHEWSQVGDFGWGIVQLANFKAPTDEPNQGGWARLREAQMLTSQSVRQTGLIVTHDIGDADDIHPRDKQTVGNRLAKWALDDIYDLNMVGSGPIYLAHRIEDGRVRIRFKNVGEGLVARGGALGGFIIAGPDGKFHWAQARIDGDSVIVWSPQVPEPKAVRYAWANNPTRANLYNSAGLPASCFRTDRWDR